MDPLPRGERAECSTEDGQHSGMPRRTLKPPLSGCTYEVIPARVIPLSPRLHRLLEALLRGLSEKQVAAELSLTQHTVHSYVKALYRHFQVHSRAELHVVVARSHVVDSGAPRPPMS
jgi:DNA-binding NarL/FixJ family response regulator